MAPHLRTNIYATVIRGPTIKSILDCIDEQNTARRDIIAAIQIAVMLKARAFLLKMLLPLILSVTI